MSPSGSAEKLWIRGYYPNQVLVNTQAHVNRGDIAMWMGAEYKMSAWRSRNGKMELWHLVDCGGMLRQFWVGPNDMKCPHTELRRWLAAR